MGATMIAAKMRQLREAAFLTQIELAIAAGTSLATIGNAERGLHVSPGTIKKIAKALGVSPSELQSVTTTREPGRSRMPRDSRAPLPRTATAGA